MHLHWYVQGSDGHEVAQKIAQQEMQVTQAALTRNPKSYSSWHHRKWIIQTHLVPLDAELRLVKQYAPPISCVKFPLCASTPDLT